MQALTVIPGRPDSAAVVDASRRNYEQAADALGTADSAWLSRLVTHRVRKAQWPTALHTGPDDVKVVVDLRDWPEFDFES